MTGGFRTAVRFWSKFVLGDDWQLACGVVAALAVTVGTATSTALPVWWIVVVAVLLLLPLSIRKVIHTQGTSAPSSFPDTGKAA